MLTTQPTFQLQLIAGDMYCMQIQTVSLLNSKWRHRSRSHIGVSLKIYNDFNVIVFLNVKYNVFSCIHLDQYSKDAVLVRIIFEYHFFIIVYHFQND